MASTYLCDASNDIYLDSNGNIATATRDIDVAGQLCKNFLNTFLGDIFTDLNLGTDWFGILLSDQVTMQDKVDEITRVLLTVPFVTGVNQVQMSQDPQAGQIAFDIEVQTNAGPLQFSLPAGV